jgi:hypothetical protein
MVFLVLLLAVGARPLTRTFRALVVLAVIINLFGAWTFDRSNKYYRMDGNAYNAVVPH